MLPLLVSSRKHHTLWYCCDGYCCGTALHGLLEGGTVLCVIRVMLRRIYCYVLTQRVWGIGMLIAEGSVKHQLPIVAVITIRAAAAGCVPATHSYTG